MGLIKRVYTDEETLITAQNLNDIQDAVIELEDGLFSIDNDKSGEVITITDAYKRGFRSLNIYGKTTQDGTPTPDAPADLVCVGNDGMLTVNVCGKNLANYPARTGQTSAVDSDGFIIATNSSTINTYIHVPVVAPYGEITVSIENIGGSDVYIQTSGSDYSVSSKASFSRTIIANGWLRVMWSITPGTTSKVRIMATKGATVLPYEPYTGQTLTIPTPNGLPGIPVTSGGNYTDANGQQWICDEIDFARGVYVQRIIKAVFGANSTGISLSETSTQFPSYNKRFDFKNTEITNVLIQDTSKKQIIMSNYAKAAQRVNQDGVWINSVDYFEGRLSIDGAIAGSVEELKTYLAIEPIVFLVPCAEPVEIPLSEEELAAYRSLYTYKDNTTVSNDAGAYMELEYVMDSKKYIDGLITGAMLPATVE